MGLYCGVDLHSNNHVVTVIDKADRRLYEKRHPNELAGMVAVLERFRDDLVGVAVESTFNWYWLVDGLMDAGFSVRLVNTTAVQQYSGLKYRRLARCLLAGTPDAAQPFAHGLHLP